MTIRVAVIGAGVMGADHARIISSALPGAELRCICDADETRARNTADATGARIDLAVAALIETAHKQAAAVLQRARPALDALAEELVAHETVDAKRLDEILVGAGFTPMPAAAVPAGPAAMAAATPVTPVPPVTRS